MILTPAQMEARNCLLEGQKSLVDPKYHHDPVKQEAWLRERCKKCWKDHGPHFPEWVKAYVEKWKLEKT